MNTALVDRKHREAHHVDPVTTGSVAATLAGLVLLPIEPVTGISLLMAGIGVAGAKLKTDRHREELEKVEKLLQVTQGEAQQAKEKASQVVHHRNRLEFENTTLRYVLIGGVVVSAGIFLYRYLSRKPCRMQRIGEQVVRVRHDVPASYSPKRAGDGDSCCIICFEHIPDVLLQPCRHLQICWSCMLNLPSATCPACRGQFHAIDFVFSG